MSSIKQLYLASLLYSVCIFIVVPRGTIINITRITRRPTVLIHLPHLPSYIHPPSGHPIETCNVRMPQQTSHHLSANTTIVLALVVLVAFFPNLFHSIWTLPLSLIPSFHSSSKGYTGTGTMTWFQKQFTLPAKSRGSYLITDQVVSNLPEIRNYKVGLLNLFVQHTSCALSLNENCM
jgi:hypothetical protein